MIYFMLFFIAAIIMDFKTIKKTKSHLFYIIIMVIALVLAIVYYSNENGVKIAEYLINLFNMEVR